MSPQPALSVGGHAAAWDGSVDAGVVARQRDLPSLALLLDDERLTRWLREAGRLGAAETAQVDRIRLKPGTRVQAAIRCGPDGTWLLAHGFTAHSWSKGQKELTVARRRGHHPLTCTQLRLVVTDMVADRDLPSLAALRPDGRDGVRPGSAALAGLAASRWSPGSGPAGAASVLARTIGYNPARRWVGTLHPALPSEVDDRRGPAGPAVAVLKVHADASATGSASRVARRLAASGVATPKAVRIRGGMVRLPWVPGTHADPMSGTDRDAVAELVSRLSRVRPRRKGTALPTLDHERIADLVTVAVVSLAAVDPVAGVRAQELAARLVPLLRGSTEDPVLVHGDLSSDQVVMGEQGPVLIDLDRAAAGPRGWDAASWMAAQAAMGTPAAQVVPLPDLLVPSPLLAAAALVRIPEPWRRRRAGHAAATSALLDLAQAALSGRTGGPR